MGTVATDYSEDREKCQRRMDEINEQPEGYNDPLGCANEEWTDLESRIGWIDSMPFLTYYFLYPGAAKDQTILSSPYGEFLVHNYRY